jgi:tryptophanyl-tRNA synthetase
MEDKKPQTTDESTTTQVNKATEDSTQTTTTSQPETTTEKPKQNITPFTVEAGEGGVDYDTLIKDFGCSKLQDDLVQRFEKLLGVKPHHFLRRKIFFCHREFNKILDCIEFKKPYYLYTGRGPSNVSLHLGHAVPFIFTKYLQEIFGCTLVIQVTDDEKFLYKKELKLDETIKMGFENIKDIIAFGFNPEKTFIFSDCEYIQYLYKNSLKIQKAITYNQIKALFGFTDSDNIGKIGFPAVQCAPCLSDCFPHIFGARKDATCLIPCAIDQDPYFRLTRDIAQKLGYPKPCTIYGKFLPALQGMQTKMSSSNATAKNPTETIILMTDKPKEIKRKVNKYAFSGGQETVEEHRKKGANLDIDISYRYLEFFLDDDEKLADIGNRYKSGQMLSGEIKAELAGVLEKFIINYQAARAKITDEDVKKFMTIRKIDPGFPEPTKKDK